MLKVLTEQSEWSNADIMNLKSEKLELQRKVSDLTEKLNEALLKESKLCKIIKQRDKEILRIKHKYEEQAAKFAVEKDTLVTNMEHGLDKLKNAFKAYLEKEKAKISTKGISSESNLNQSLLNSQEFDYSPMMYRTIDNDCNKNQKLYQSLNNTVDARKSQDHISRNEWNNVIDSYFNVFS